MESSALQFSHSRGYGCLRSSSQPLFASASQWKPLLLPTHRLSPSQLHSYPSPHPRHALASSSCPEPPHHPSHLDRRHLLLASSLGLAGLPLVHSIALAAPVEPPNFQQCNTPIDPGNGVASLDCCLPLSTTISDYTIPANLPMRVRRPAQFASPDYIAKYTKAYELLRELPEDDPRQYTQQWKVHCAFCDGAYDETGTSIEYEVHNSWFFFPWHRWYLYFHERILAKLIDDDTFALPFWNWDSATGNTFPPLYINSQSSLYDSNRSSAHQPPTTIDLSFVGTEAGRSAAAQQKYNNALMYRQVVTNAKTPLLFFGQPYRQGDAASPGPGSVENVPHGPVHAWTGNLSNPNGEDMAALYSAARDPIFFAHHANIDRLWEVWKGLGGRRKDLTDTDYLNATFLFYDENAQLVRVKISDNLNMSKLRYGYEKVNNDWLTARPSKKSSTSTGTTSFGPSGGPSTAMAALKDKFKGLEEFNQRKSKLLDQIISAYVKRPKKVKADDYDEEILVFKGVEVPMNETVKFDVYINLPEADEKDGPDISEYAGSFFSLPHSGSSMKMAGSKSLLKTTFRLGIGEVLKELGVEDDDSFSVTIVPKSKNKVSVAIEDVILEYE